MLNPDRVVENSLSDVIVGSLTPPASTKEDASTILTSLGCSAKPALARRVRLDFAHDASAGRHRL